ncbi:MAG: valine--tRNA ligase [Gemmatimonadetes bacterium]|nr:valine--tRNA ligase [Gemmatimonadota bacterium]|tara:strand:+ start:1579 stop:4344 length:2766 start_codon:yes stop_codon:yes gene_type:complete
MNPELEKTYDPKSAEEKWYAHWEEKGYFNADPNPEKTPYCITIPPPNVTGELHMGHAIQHAIHDLVVRWKRMQGYETLCLPGTDHAGIATQMKVEQQLAAEEGLNRYDIGREALLEKIHAWRDKYGDAIYYQLRKLGSSYDWRRARFTLDEGYVEAVLQAFEHFGDQGWIYRGRRMINWCPKCRTVISDLETEEKELDGHLWHIRYPGLDGGPDVVVATTRPETMLGDTGVAVHPSDKRWSQAVGQRVLLPLVERAIPIVPDDYADPEMGSGAVKVTPCHDPNDYAIGERHDLEQIQVIGFDGIMTKEAGRFAGMDRYACRKQLISELDEAGLLVEVVDHPHAVPHHDKCGTVIEPLPMEQWFMNMEALAEKTRSLLISGQIAYVPDRFNAYALEWLDNIRDWALSRQIWWGHRIPAWYCLHCSRDGLIPMGGLDPEKAFAEGSFRVSVADGAKPYVRAHKPDACPDCGGREWVQDPDVLDTWFSSALWPFATLGWPEKTDSLSYFYPTDLMITGRDILYLWVLRMVMTSIECRDEIPFKTVLVHPTILTKDGRRMSKSLGTGLNPLDLVDLYGADATRFSLLAQAGAVQDVRFDAEVKNNVVLSSSSAEMGRNFGNKVWNAARFVTMNMDGYEPGLVERGRGELADRWIWSRLAQTIAEVNFRMEAYRFSDVIRALYDFLWRDYCDWYLELAKGRLQADQPELRLPVQRNLVEILEIALRLLHPVMPFMTESLWQALPKKGSSAESIVISSWPESLDGLVDLVAEQDMERVQEIVTAVRTVRSEMNVPPATKIPVILSLPNANGVDELEAIGPLVSGLVRASEITVGIAVDPPAASGSAVVGAVEVFVPLEGIIDLGVERGRLEKEVAKFEKLVKSMNGKLANEKFIANAPADVVKKERERLIEYGDTLEMLRDSLQRIS